MATQPTIAIVDDRESVRRGLARMLGGPSLGVELFSSGQQFLDSLTTRYPDCVLLDYQMPGLTGLQVQRRLALAGLSLPVIVITADDQPALREQCLREGAVAYLAKPLQRERLIRVIDEILKAHSSVLRHPR